LSWVFYPRACRCAAPQRTMLARVDIFNLSRTILENQQVAG
jgi:hypothetical protein